MTLKELAFELSQALGLDVFVAPDSLDACVAVCRGDSRRVILSAVHSPIKEATLSAAVKRTRSTVLCGGVDELAHHAEAMARAVGPGRLVRAWEWAVDSDAVTYGRVGGIGADEPEEARTLAESPVSPSPKVFEAMRAAVNELAPQRYPPLIPDALVNALAAHHDVEPSQVVVSGSGSVELLQRVVRACTDPGDEVQAFAPTFDRMPSLCAQQGLVLRLSKEPVAASTARLVYVVTPNGPDARVTSAAELESMRRALPADRVLVVDRAYADLDDADPLMLDAPGPVVVLRTLSKAGALAGLRIGWAIAPEPIARLLRRFALPYGVSEFAARAALALLADDAHREAARVAVKKARDTLAGKLESDGFTVLGANGHLLCVKAPEHLRARLDADETLPFQPVEGSDGVYTVSASAESSSGTKDRSPGT